MKNQENALSSANLQQISELIGATLLADKENELLQVQNYYSVYLMLEKEQNKENYKANVAKVCEGHDIKIKTWANKRSTFNTAIKYGVNVELILSEKKLIEATKAIKYGDSKVLKNGKVKTDSVGTAKNVAEKREIQAVNENELIELLANPEFKRCMDFIEKSGTLKATFMKAWAKHQAL